MTEAELRAMLNGREAFEAWAKQQGVDGYDITPMPDNEGNLHYRHHRTWEAYEGFKSRDPAISYLLDTIGTMGEALTETKRLAVSLIEENQAFARKALRDNGLAVGELICTEQAGRLFDHKTAGVKTAQALIAAAPILELLQERKP